MSLYTKSEWLGQKKSESVERVGERYLWLPADCDIAILQLQKFLSSLCTVYNLCNWCRRVILLCEIRFICEYNQKFLFIFFHCIESGSFSAMPKPAQVHSSASRWVYIVLATSAILALLNIFYLHIIWSIDANIVCGIDYHLNRRNREHSNAGSLLSKCQSQPQSQKRNAVSSEPQAQ